MSLSNIQSIHHQLDKLSNSLSTPFCNQEEISTELNNLESQLDALLISEQESSLAQISTCQFRLDGIKRAFERIFPKQSTPPPLNPFAGFGLQQTPFLNPGISKHQGPPLVGNKVPFISLQDGWHKPAIKANIAAISKDFPQFRAIRGEGNCFYTAFIVTWLEYLRQDVRRIDSAIQQFLDHRVSCLTKDKAIETLFALRELRSDSDFELLLNDSNRLLEVVDYLRRIASDFMQKHPDDFTASLIGVDYPGTLQDYCKNVVEQMGVEAEDLAIGALTQALDFKLTIVQLTRRNDSGLYSIYDLPDTPGAPKGAVLYQPGHYGAVYSKNH